MLTVALVSFVLFQFVGDPISFILGQDATLEVKTRLRGELGLEDPIPVQFAHFVGNAVRGDFGFSLRQGGKVSDLLASKAPATLELSFVVAICGGGPTAAGELAE